MSDNIGMYPVGSVYYLMYELGIFTNLFWSFFSFVLCSSSFTPFLLDVQDVILKHEGVVFLY